MNENMRKWIAALRSGEFKQGTGTLRTHDDTYCCLGVACELHRREVGGKWDKFVDFQNPFSYLCARNYLPMEVMKWLGVDHNNPMVSVLGRYHHLAILNDKGRGFKEIADAIDRTFTPKIVK